MATNQDFNNLITRIDTATEQLEVNVTTLTESGADVAQAVVEAKGYATEAKASKTSSEQSATTATQQATKATTEANRATKAVEDAKALAPFNEAPKDGQTYGRKDGSWSVVTGNGGSGTVTSVNNVKPDETGNVTITIPQPVEQVNADWNAVSGKAQILNKPTLFSGSYTDLTNKPSIPTKVSELTNDSGFINDAPKDNKQYARKDGVWTEVEASGGSGGYTTKESWTYNGKSVTEWQTLNPHEALELSKVGAYVTGEWTTGADLITFDGMKNMPSGRYWFKTNDFTTAPLQGKKGYLEVVEAPTVTLATQKEVIVTVVDANNVITTQYKLESNNTFTPLNMSPRKAGTETWNVASNIFTTGITELFTGMLWSGAFGSTTILSKTNGASAPNSLPVGLYKFSSDAEIGGTSSSTPFSGRQGIIAVVEFLPTLGASRTGQVANKQVLAMSWKGTTGADIQFHVWTGDKQWITK